MQPNAPGEIHADQPRQLGDFLGDPSRLVGDLGDSERTRQIHQTDLRGDVVDLQQRRDDLIVAMQAGTAPKGARQLLDGYNQQLLSTTADLVDQTGTTVTDQNHK